MGVTFHPFAICLGQTQVTGPAHSQREGTTQKHEQQEAGVMGSPWGRHCHAPGRMRALQSQVGVSQVRLPERTHTSQHPPGGSVTSKAQWQTHFLGISSQELPLSLGAKLQVGFCCPVRTGRASMTLWFHLFHLNLPSIQVLWLKTKAWRGKGFLWDHETEQMTHPAVPYGNGFLSHGNCQVVICALS